MELNDYQKKLPKFILELAEKYDLKLPKSERDNEADFWRCHNNWILKHDACEKIAKREGIIFETPTVNFDSSPSVALLIKGTYIKTINDKEGNFKEFEEIKEWSFGEANANNTRMPYWWAMAEKRGKDRVILKLIGAYEKGLYSEVESDSWDRLAQHDKDLDDLN